MTAAMPASRCDLWSLGITLRIHTKFLVVIILLLLKIPGSTALISSIQRCSAYCGVGNQMAGTVIVGKSQITRVRVDRSHVLMSPQEHEKQSKRSTQIQFLLTKAAEMVSKMTPSAERRNDGARSVADVKSSIPLSLSFSSRHKYSISLRDPAAALKYLTLPVESYSVLDSNLVERSSTSPDTFILSLPLGDITSASTLGAGGSSGILLAATLRTEVSVKPDAEKGIVVMESGPIYFIPTVSPKKVIIDSEANTSAPNFPAGFSDALPEWLLWGGQTSSARPPVSETNSFSGGREGEGSESGIDASVEKDAVLKSSIQARFRIELQWNNQGSLGRGRLSGINNLFARANGLRSSFFTRKETASNEVESTSPQEDEFSPNSAVANVVEDRYSNTIMEPVSNAPSRSPDFIESTSGTNVTDEEFLPVAAVVKVWVDINLPLQADLSSALSFPPVKILLSQAGALTTKAVLSAVAPVLGKLLSSDHEKRLEKLSVANETSEEAESDVIIARATRESVSIYDDLTADIGIK